MPDPIDSLSRRLAAHAEGQPDVLALTRLGPDGSPVATLDWKKYIMMTIFSGDSMSLF